MKLALFLVAVAVGSILVARWAWQSAGAHVAPSPPEGDDEVQFDPYLWR
jgi:hypothetical protein